MMAVNAANIVHPFAHGSLHCTWHDFGSFPESGVESGLVLQGIVSEAYEATIYMWNIVHSTE